MLKPLVQRSVQAARAGDIGARGLTNIVYEAACSGREEQMCALVMVLAYMAERLVTDFNAQDVANTAWVFAKIETGG